MSLEVFPEMQHSDGIAAPIAKKRLEWVDASRALTT